MTSTEIFQQQHGSQWAGLVNTEAFPAAMLVLNEGIFNEIVNLSAEQIASPAGNVILAKLQGQLLHEQGLIRLSTIQSNLVDDTLEATFPDPLDELETAADEQDSITGSTVFRDFGKASDNLTGKPISQPQPKPKRKPRKRRKTK